MKKKMLCGLAVSIAVAVMVVCPAGASAKGSKRVSAQAPVQASAEREEYVKAMMAFMDEQLAAMGEPMRVGAVEYYTAAGEAGQIVLCNDRTKQLGTHWVPGDPRREERNNIIWTSDLVDGDACDVSGGTLGLLQTQAALLGGMLTWEMVNCSKILLEPVMLDPSMDWGYCQKVWAAGGGGYGGADFPPCFYGVDIAHSGWLPGGFFDWWFGPGAGDVIIGVTLWWVFADGGTGEPTDTDENGKLDTACVEIYYNNKFPWGIGTNWPLDVQTVVTHEAGHALSQDHFGKIFVTKSNGKVHFAPRAVMNAMYSGMQQDLTGTDIGGHCSIWGKWPKK